MTNVELPSDGQILGIISAYIQDPANHSKEVIPSTKTAREGIVRETRRRLRKLVTHYNLSPTPETIIDAWKSRKITH